MTYAQHKGNPPQQQNVTTGTLETRSNTKKKGLAVSPASPSTDRITHKMTLTETQISPHEIIAQLDTQIHTAKEQRRRVLVAWIAELDAAGKSLRQIGNQVGISHVAVHHILNGYKGGK